LSISFTFGMDVARDGDVDQEHRVVPPRRRGRADALDVEHVVVGADAGDDDVAQRQARRRDRRARGPAAVLLGERARVLDRRFITWIAVTPRLRNAATGELAHLAGADDDELLLGEGPGRSSPRASTRRTGTETFFSPSDGRRVDALGDREGLLEEAVEDAARGAGGLGGEVGVLDLSDDLGSRRGPSESRLDVTRKRWRTASVPWWW
jgi:hypothetical protein